MKSKVIQTDVNILEFIGLHHHAKFERNQSAHSTLTVFSKIT